MICLFIMLPNSGMDVTVFPSKTVSVGISRANQTLSTFICVLKHKENSLILGSFDGGGAFYERNDDVEKVDLANILGNSCC